MAEKKTRTRLFFEIAGPSILISLVVVCFLGYRFWAGLNQDGIWKRKVKRQLNLEEARSWALSALQYYSPTNYADCQFMLTNAPPHVMVYEDGDGHGLYMQLTLGGGLYHWGLTIGQTNLLPSFARGEHPEEWAPGTYYWNF